MTLVCLSALHKPILPPERILTFLLVFSLFTLYPANPPTHPFSAQTSPKSFTHA